MRPEVGIGLKVMIPFFREVKACRLVMNIKFVGAVAPVHLMWRHIGAV
jgi:hypothetical protein